MSYFTRAVPFHLGHTFGGVPGFVSHHRPPSIRDVEDYGTRHVCHADDGTDLPAVVHDPVKTAFLRRLERRPYFLNGAQIDFLASFVQADDFRDPTVLTKPSWEVPHLLDDHLSSEVFHMRAFLGMTLMVLSHDSPPSIRDIIRLADSDRRFYIRVFRPNQAVALCIDGDRITVGPEVITDYDPDVGLGLGVHRFLMSTAGYRGSRVFLTENLGPQHKIDLGQGVTDALTSLYGVSMGAQSGLAKFPADSVIIISGRLVVSFPTASFAEGAIANLVRYQEFVHEHGVRFGDVALLADVARLENISVDRISMSGPQLVTVDLNDGVTLGDLAEFLSGEETQVRRIIRGQSLLVDTEDRDGNIVMRVAMAEGLDSEIDRFVTQIRDESYGNGMIFSPAQGSLDIPTRAQLEEKWGDHEDKPIRIMSNELPENSLVVVKNDTIYALKFVR